MAADFESLFKEGRLLFRQRKYPEAIGLFQKALNLDPDHAEAHDAIATAYFVTKEYDKAIGHFTRVTQLKPMDAKAYINLGAVNNRKEEFQKAADLLKKAISRDGKAVEAYYNLGIAYRGLKQPAMAVNSYKEALKLNPRMLDAMQNLANTYVEMNNLKSAIEQYKKALEIEPDFERAARGLARAEAMQNEAKESFNPFGRLVGQTATKQATVEVRARKLSPEERMGDRQFVRRVMIELQAVTQQLQEHLRDQLLEDVMQVNRGVQMSRGEVHKSLFSSTEQFQVSFQKYQTLRSQAERLETELRKHEAEMKVTP